MPIVFEPLSGRTRRCRPLLAALLSGGVLLQSCIVQAEPVAVRHTEGVVHGFLILRTLEGTHLADGELGQFVRGDQVTSRLAFQFKDGSIHEETVVYSQRGKFRLLSNHLVQKGPAFPAARDVRIDGVSGDVTARYTDDGKEKLVSERLDLPADVANGLTLTLIKNLPRGAGDHGVDCGGHAQAWTGEGGDPVRGRGAVLDRRLQAHRPPLCREGKTRGAG